MTRSELTRRLAPVIAQMEKNASVADSFIDKQRYSVFLGTLWSNLVLEPEQLDLTVDDLEIAFEVLNENAKKVLGGEDPITDSFRFISSPEGEKSLERFKITKNHRDLLAYFSSMILDPDGHKKWMKKFKEENPRFR